jgi:hypothetical protein
MPNTSDSPLIIPSDDFTADEKGHRSNNSAFRQFGNIAFLAFVPVGGIIGYGGNTAPAGWLNCNGAAINRRSYKELFSIIGTNYGVGDGSTTFNVPTYAQARAIYGGTAAAPANGILLIRAGVY